MADIYASLSDNVVELVGFVDVRSNPPTPITDATVTAQVTDARDRPVGAPVPMPAVAGTPGSYRGDLPLDLPVVEGEPYRVRVSANGGAGRRRVFRGNFIVD